MNKLACLVSGLLVTAVVACGGDSTPDIPTDAGGDALDEAGNQDASTADSGSSDAGVTDASKDSGKDASQDASFDGGQDAGTCATTTCGANATCSQGDAGPACACDPGFSGDGQTCTQIDDCAGTPCMNGGACTDGTNSYTCDCSGTGYSGTNCETNVDDCAGNPCQNGGACTDGVNSYSCTCALGYSGTTCDTVEFSTTNLVGYWNFEQTAGTVSDLSGNGNDATSVTATQAAGKVGMGYAFNGSQCIGIPDSASLALDAKAAITMMVWENYTGNGEFLNKENTWEMAVGATSSGKLQEALPFGFGGWNWFGAEALTASSWQHVAVTWDGANVIHYIDGNPVYTRAQSGTFAAKTYGLGIGCRGVATDGSLGSASQYLTGMVDEAFVYDRALTDVEISDYYNRTQFGAPSGTSCAAIKQANGAATDGIYFVDPDGAGGVPAMRVYCDMTTDGGGWTKILQINTTAYTPTAAASGNVTTATTPTFAKLSDAAINALGTSIGAGRVYRLAGPTSPTGKKLFIFSTGTFDDTAIGMGLMSSTLDVCETADFANCTPSTVNATYIDSFAWGLVANDDERYFADYAGSSVNCYNPSAAGVRCFNAGVASGHPFIPNTSLWIK